MLVGEFRGAETRSCRVYERKKRQDEGGRGSVPAGFSPLSPPSSDLEHDFSCEVMSAHPVTGDHVLWCIPSFSWFRAPLTRGAS